MEGGEVGDVRGNDGRGIKEIKGRKRRGSVVK